MIDPSSDSARHGLLDLTLRLDDLKNVVRENPLSRGDRRERTAEHSWHVAMAVLLWAPESPHELDVPRAVTLAVVHDFPELFEGDTPVHAPGYEERYEKEAAAMSRFVEGDVTRRAPEVYDWWHEYEHGTSPEARFVMAVDVLLPVLHNHSQLEQSSWTHRQASAAVVSERIETVRRALPWLAERADECVARAIEAEALQP